MQWVDATDLQQWADRRECQDTLPQVLRRLVHATVNQVQRADFPSGDSVLMGGWDGLVEVTEGNSFVPSGHSAWELGTEKGPTTKANGDYRKRTTDSGGVCRSTTTFVFVTPRRWARRREWEKSKRAERRWRSVRALDADTLEQWLEQTPSVGVWLARLIGKIPEGVRSLDQYWNEWSFSTNPSLSPELVLGDRNQESESLLASLQGPPVAVVIEGDKSDEAIAFVAAAVNSLAEPDRHRQLSRAVVVDNESAFRALSNSRNPVLLILGNGDAGAAGLAVRNGHHVIIPVGREGRRRDRGITLRRISRDTFVAALTRMGISEDDSRRLARETARTLPALQRRLSIVPGTRQPDWARPEHARSLIPILLLGAWDASVLGDRQVVERIAEVRYEAVSASLTRWANSSDPPLHRMGDVWKLVAPLDAWFLLASSLTPEDFQRLEQVALEVLGARDPALDLPVEERWAAAIHCKQLPHSSWLREGLANTLALIGIFGDETGAYHGAASSREKIAGAVYRLLRNAQGPVWASLSSVLPLLAEAAPDTFLDCVESALAARPSPMLDMFQEEAFIGPFSPHTGLLRALESLAWDPHYLTRVAVILAQLSRMDFGDKSAKRPQTSLRAIFLPWMPQTCASLDQRVSALDVLVEREPAAAWQLLVALAPQGSGIATDTHKPRWRDLPIPSTRPITSATYWQSVDPVLTRLQRGIGASGERWAEILGIIQWFPLNHRVTFRRVLGHSIDAAEQEDRGVIRNAVRQLLHRHRTFRDARWALAKVELDEFQEIYEVLEPVDLVARYRWLFDDYWPQLPQGRKKGSTANDQEVHQARYGALHHVRVESGLKGIMALVQAVRRPDTVGSTLAGVTLDPNDEREVVELATSDPAGAVQGFLSGFVTRRIAEAEWAWAESLLSRAEDEAWPADKILRLLLALPARHAVWTRLPSFGPEVERRYWSEVMVFLPGAAAEEVKTATEQLLKAGRPKAALHAADLSPEALPSELIVRLLEGYAVSEPAAEGEVPATFEIERFFEALDNATDVEEGTLAHLEWLYFPLLQHGTRRLRVLQAALVRDPRMFVTMLSFAYRPEHSESSEADQDASVVSATVRERRAPQAWQLLESLDTLPGATETGGLDATRLMEWIKESRALATQIDRAASCDSRIGVLLANSPSDPDGTWPLQLIRDLIESIGSEHLDEGLYVGLINKRGVTTRTLGEGGRPERDLAAQYSRDSEALAARWPRTSAILHRVAKNYEYQARREDIDAGLRESR